ADGNRRAGTCLKLDSETVVPQRAFPRSKKQRGKPRPSRLTKNAETFTDRLQTTATKRVRRLRALEQARKQRLELRKPQRRLAPADGVHRARQHAKRDFRGESDKRSTGDETIAGFAHGALLSEELISRVIESRPRPPEPRSRSSECLRGQSEFS